MATTSLSPRTEALHEALRAANRVKRELRELRQELRCGVLTVRQALEDPRSAPMGLFDLLTSVHRFGDVSARKFLARLELRETKRVRELTERQRSLIADAWESRL